jgi:hypothetical protein
MAPHLAPRARRVRAALAIALLPLAGACATVSGTSAAPQPTIALDQTDGVVWVRARDVAHTRVVLSGAAVKVLRGARAQKGDTVFARPPFAIALPDGAFELSIAAEHEGRPARHVAPVASIELRTAGEKAFESVRAEGSLIVLRREAAGSPVLLSGARVTGGRSAGGLGDR